MLTKSRILQLLNELNEYLATKNISGEICLYGGAAMCLVFDARPTTKDVDAIFHPSTLMREAIRDIGRAHGFREDWLNDAVKGFVVTHPSRVVLSLSNLQVYSPEPDYLLAMKAMAARTDATDKDDVIHLIRTLKLKSAKQVFTLIEKYYPRERIRPVTQFFIEELFQHEKPKRTKKRH